MTWTAATNTHACQARDRDGCTLHASPGSDLCPSCLRAEAEGHNVPRIAKPVFDREGRRINRLGFTAVTDKLKAESGIPF